MFKKKTQHLSYFLLFSCLNLLISSCQSSTSYSFNSISEDTSSSNQIPKNTSQIPKNISQIPKNTSQIPKNISQIPKNTSQIPKNISQIPKNTSLGTNLSGVVDYSTQMPFIDHFKSARRWITQCKKSDIGCQGKWDTQEYQLLDLDENGWVKSLPKPEDAPEYTRVSTVMFQVGANNFPGGKYIVLYDGEGKIEYGPSVKKITSESRLGRDVIEVNSSRKGGILLTITETDPRQTGNYIRNLKVIQAKQESLLNQGEIFNPLFLEKTKPFSTLRFMDWMRTNNSQQQEWQNRPRPTDASYTTNGVPVEIMVALANKLKKDAWFNMPHQATEDYIKNFADLVKKDLDPQLKIYVEFSNEVWNWQFKQARYAMEEAKKRWGQEGNARMDWYGMRTAQMCNIWKEVFADQKNRIICVISTQTGWKGLEKKVLNCPLWVAEGNQPCYQQGISAYAITGYFGGSLGVKKNQLVVKSWLNQTDGGFSSAFKQLKQGGLFTDKRQRSLEDTLKLFTYHQQVAKEKGLQLVVYEGGQHIVGVKAVKNDSQLNNFFIELNRRPEMYELYLELLNSWQQSGGGLFMHFSDIYRPNKHGSWGALENLEQPASPKYKALVDFIKKLESDNQLKISVQQ